MLETWKCMKYSILYYTISFAVSCISPFKCITSQYYHLLFTYVIKLTVTLSAHSVTNTSFSSWNQISDTKITMMFNNANRDVFCALDHKVCYIICISLLINLMFYYFSWKGFVNDHGVDWCLIICQFDEDGSLDNRSDVAGVSPGWVSDPSSR